MNARKVSGACRLCCVEARQGARPGVAQRALLQALPSHCTTCAGSGAAAAVRCAESCKGRSWACSEPHAEWAKLYQAGTSAVAARWQRRQCSRCGCGVAANAAAVCAGGGTYGCVSGSWGFG